jgi:putative transposase
MTNENLTLLHRRSIRRKEYDYTSPGAFIITILARNRSEIFSHIYNDKIILSALGRLARKYWLEIPQHFPQVDIKPYVIIPNHIHGVLTIHSDPSKGTTCRALTPRLEKFGHPVSGSIPTIIRSYKSAVTKSAKLELNLTNIWHRGYYEHIIRNEDELKKICLYILTNPLNWKIDNLHADTYEKKTRIPSP